MNLERDNYEERLCQILKGVTSLKKADSASNFVLDCSQLYFRARTIKLAMRARKTRG